MRLTFILSAASPVCSQLPQTRKIIYCTHWAGSSHSRHLLAIPEVAVMVEPWREIVKSLSAVCPPFTQLHALAIVSRSKLNLGFYCPISGSFSCGTSRAAHAFGLVLIGNAVEVLELRVQWHRLPHGEEIPNTPPIERYARHFSHPFRFVSFFQTMHMPRVQFH